MVRAYGLGEDFEFVIDALGIFRAVLGPVEIPGLPQSCDGLVTVIKGGVDHSKEVQGIGRVVGVADLAQQC
jgi:hypothetical protein